MRISGADTLETGTFPFYERNNHGHYFGCTDGKRVCGGSAVKGIRLVHGSIMPPYIGGAGAQFLVEDDEAVQAVASGMLEYIPGDEHNEIAPAEVPEHEKPREMTLEERYAEILNADGSPRADLLDFPGNPDAREPAAERDEPLKKPYGNQPKSLWVAYAIQQGEDPERAETMSKADLMSKHGERL